jgi:amino-acid N-acetyltransferase
MSALEFHLAESGDEKVIGDLLIRCGLKPEGIGPHLSHFVVAVEQGIVVGTAGCEIHGSVGLFRSFAVDSAHRGRGIGTQLYQRLLAHARLKGVRDGYLLTETAAGFFAKLGFQRAERQTVPMAVKELEQFRTQCPESAVCMEKLLISATQYYPREVLQLQPDVPGARFWGVSLEKCMLTYFEVDPHTRFEQHRHESEQITMVLEGELVFEMADGNYTVKAGEVVAIPSGVQHSVYSKEHRVKAVDVWSPVLAAYQS